MLGQLVGVLASQVPECVQDLNIGYFLDTISVINVKLCVMALLTLTELYQFTPLSVTLTILQDYSIVKEL